jgi:N-acyl homoserine lactone hydrolase
VAPLAAHAAPAALPLPGGRAGASVRLRPLLSGWARLPPGLLERGEGPLAPLRALGLGVPREQWLRVPIGSFLLEHPRAGPVLVDTGLHPSLAADPAENLGRLYARFARGLELRAPVPDRLLELGVDPLEVRAVVMTHLHLDHASAMSEFPSAAFLVDELEWDAARSAFGVLRGYLRRHLDHPLEVRLLDFDAPPVDAFATFGRSLDLFGDGSVRLLATPGHSPGHLSVVLRLRDREALLCGDAAFTTPTLDYGRQTGPFADGHLFGRSLREIQRYREQTPTALIVPGHDAEAWEALEPVYD